MKRLTASVLVLLGSVALADSRTASTQVTLTVLPDCSLSATDMDLGVYNFRTGASGTATVRVKCNVNADVTFSPNRANNSQRILNGPGGSQIPYHLQELLPPAQNDIGFDNPFANVDFSNTDTTGSFTVKSTSQGSSFLLRGTVAPGLWKPAGQYTDLITFTMTYTP